MLRPEEEAEAQEAGEPVIAPLHSRPAGLPEALKWCGWCGAATHKAYVHKCPEARGALPPRVGPPESRASKGGKRDGSHAEEALYAALAWVWWEAAPGGYPSEPRLVSTMWVRQYPWGAYLSPPRRFSADAGFPFARLLVEVEGQAHSIKGRRTGDVLKSQLADAAGWKVLRVLPEQVRDGTAVALIAAALSAKEV